MIGDKELICRALLGDQEAQKECTEKGILIPCPWCKGEMQICHGDTYGYYKTKCIRCGAESPEKPNEWETSVYKGYKQDKIEMRGDRAEMSDFPLYLNMVAGGLDCRDQAIGGFSFVVKIYAVPVVEIIG